MTPESLAPRPHRSERTVDKLLRSAIYLLDEGCGLEGCTVDRITNEARVPQGRIYRRYDSNDAFLSAIFLRYLEQVIAPPEELFATLYRASFESTVERVVETILKPYYMHPEVHRAMDAFLNSKPESQFAREAPGRIGDYMRSLAAVLLPHRAVFAHADPESAAMIAVLTAAGSIEDTILSTDARLDKELPRATRHFAGERTRSMVAYLRGVPEASAPPNMPYPARMPEFEG